MPSRTTLCPRELKKFEFEFGHAYGPINRDGHHDDRHHAHHHHDLVWHVKSRKEVNYGGWAGISWTGKRVKHFSIIIIIITRPRPAFGRLGLGGLLRGHLASCLQRSAWLWINISWYFSVDHHHRAWQLKTSFNDVFNCQAWWWWSTTNSMICWKEDLYWKWKILLYGWLGITGTVRILASLHCCCIFLIFCLYHKHM